MARRYAIHLPPVAHMNGKLAPSSYICHNQPDTHETDVSYYYGYRYTKRPDISRYAIRDRARDLSVNPYTPGETRSKAMFEECVDIALQLLHDATIRPRIEEAFRMQRKYIRLYNYTIAELVKHNGNVPW